MHVTSISAAESGARKYLLREPVKEAWAELRVAPNLERKNSAIAGLTEMCENSREGMRQPSNMAYPLHGVKVLTNTVVHRVSFSGTTATGVELADGRKIYGPKGGHYLRWRLSNSPSPDALRHRSICHSR